MPPSDLEQMARGFRESLLETGIGIPGQSTEDNRNFDFYLTALLKRVRSQGFVDALEKIVASLKAWPHAGIDIKVGEAVEDLLQRVRDEAEREQDERIIGKLTEWVEYLKTAPQALVHKRGVQQGRDETSEEWEKAVTELRDETYPSMALTPGRKAAWEEVCNQILRRMGRKP